MYFLSLTIELFPSIYGSESTIKINLQENYHRNSHFINLD
jgi:hypothetical protein